MSLLGPDDPKTLESMTQLGWILNREGHYAEAEKLERQALDGRTPRSRTRGSAYDRDHGVTWPSSCKGRVISARERNWRAR